MMRFPSVMLVLVCPLLIAAEPAPFRISVRLDPKITASVAGERVIVVLGRAGSKNPRSSIGNTGMDAAPILGTDATAPRADGVIAELDNKSIHFPLPSLAALKPGKYSVQAVVHRNRDLNFPNAPGDLYGPAVDADIDFSKPGNLALTIDSAVPDEAVPADTDRVKFLKFPSKLLSDFHGRPMFYRAAVVLPADFDKEPTRKYPLRVHIGGYGSRYTMARSMGMRRPTEPKFLTLVLDGAGPFGDPYQVNSANTGPFGDALTRELIPHVEATYRGVGAGHARFTDGHSTGGWVSLALQIFYPDYFGGCWSFCPDPVDFRAFEVINIYKSQNAYVNDYGFERPAKRLVNGDVVYTVRHENHVERVLGRGDRWTLSGKDWGAWNATFGPRGDDGLPKPLWDGATGAIDKSVLDHWKKYDLRLVAEENWGTLGPKLRGKLHIYAGDCDDYFLNNAVRLMDRFLQQAKPPAEATVVIGPYASHSFHPLSEKQTLDAMQAAFEKGGGATRTVPAK
ncbi:MAG: esterase family protein [Gemmataceae bacterium]|nr:esterase family protein [Gemmataceae bacterium]